MTLPSPSRSSLAVLAAAHAWWAMGRIWPAASEPSWRARVIGDGRSRMPPPWQCAAVAVRALAVAAWPWVVAAPGRDSQLVLIGSIVVGAVFFLRGTAGYSPRWRAASRPSRFARATSTSIRRSAWRWAWASSRC